MSLFRHPHHVSGVSTEQSGVVSLLNHYEGDPWLVVFLQLHTGLPHRPQLVLQDLQRKEGISKSTIRNATDQLLIKV